MLEAIAHMKKQGALNKNETPINLAGELFRLHNRSEGKSLRTVEWYDAGVGMLIRPKGPFSPETQMGRISELELRAFIADLSNRLTPAGNKISPATFNNYVRAIKTFFRWAHDEGFTDEWLLGSMKSPKVPLKLIETLTDEEIARLLREVRSHPGEHALFVLMLDTGLRASELSNLRLADVDLEQGVVRVISGKGGKSRVVPFGTKTQKLILEWVAHHRSDTALNSLFVNRSGLPYTKDSLRTLMRRLGRRTGVDRLHTHLLRHTFATRFLEAGGNAIYLKMNLGHNTMAMTERYVHLVGERAAAATRQFSPMDRFRDRPIESDDDRSRRVSRASGF